MFKGFLMLVSLLLATTSAQAAYTGPQELPRVFSTVIEALEYPVDDHEIAFEGHITKRIGHDKYLFRDKTGSIRLEIDAGVFPADDINDKTRVKIYGEIDSKVLDNPMVDVDRIEIVK